MLYQVDADEVAASAAQASRSGEAIRAEVAALVAQLHALEGSWQGSAAAAFSGVLAQWRGAQAHVEQALESLTQALGAAAAGYAEAEATAARMFAR